MLCLGLFSCSSTKISSKSEEIKHNSKKILIPNNKKDDSCSGSLNDKSESDKIGRLRYVEIATKTEAKMIVEDIKNNSMINKKEYISKQCKSFAKNMKNSGSSTYQCSFSGCYKQISIRLGKNK
jgi:hypothetical protein